MKTKSRQNAYKMSRERVWQPVQWLRPTDKKLSQLPRPVVLVNGAFDLLHSSHMRLIYTAKDHAKTVVCALDSDRKVRQEKGEGRPIMSFIERAATLNYMPVDYVVEIDSQADMDNLMELLQPDLRVQNIEYKGRPSRYPTIKKLFIRTGSMHTSKIIKRIQNGK